MTETPITPRRSVDRQSWSVGLATGVYGISFGALSVASGLSLLQTQVLSLAMFSGASQFAFISLASAGAVPAAIGTAALLGLRNGFYAVAMSPVVQARSWRKTVAAHLTIDESTAVATSAAAQFPEDASLARRGFWTTGAAVFLLWNAATLLGAFAGDALGDPRRYGLDAAAAAAFVALLWPRLNNSLTRIVAAGALAISVVLAPLTPAGIPVLVAAGFAVLVGSYTHTREGASDGRG